MDSSVRVQTYYFDMGLYRKQDIRHMRRQNFEEMNRPNSNWKAIELAPDDWYGKKLPDTIRL